MTAQAGILTITLNPAVDVSTTVAEVVAGPKLRCDQPRFDPGGGGVNVARTVNKLGGTATALVAVGGAMGDRLLALLAAEKVPALPVAVSGETRQSFAVTDDSTGAQYRFGVPGQHMTETDAAGLIAAAAENAPSGGYVVLSGSVAPGLPADFQSQVIAAIARKNCKVIVDTSSKALARLIANPAVPVEVLRIDQLEAAESAEHPIATAADSADFGANLIARGVANIVVTGRGAEGSVLVSKEHRLLCRPPPVKEISKIGAGDAFVGGMTLALARGDGVETALKWGVAAASATVGTKGTALCDPGTVKRRLAQCSVVTV